MDLQIAEVCAIASTPLPCGSFLAIKWKPRAMAPISIKWKMSNDQGTGRARRGLFLGHAGSHTPTAGRDLHPRRLHRRKSTKCHLPQPRGPCRSHRDRFRSGEELLEFYSRFATRQPSIARATIEAPATAPPSSARATSKEKSRKTQSPMSKLRICGLARWSQKSRPPATSVKLIYLESFPAGYTCHFVRPNWKLPRRAG